MQLIQSLLCLKGSDNRSRFIVINTLLYAVFMMLTAMAYDYIIFNIILLFIVSFLSTASILRRLNDAQLKKSWSMMAASLFFISGIIIILTQSNYAYWLLLMPFSCVLLLLYYPSKRKRSYVMGYHGPVDLSQYQVEIVQHSHRIEPSIIGDALIPENYIAPQTKSDLNQDSTHAKVADIASHITSFIQNNRKIVFSIFSVLFLSFVIMMLMTDKTHHEENTNEAEEEPVALTSAVTSKFSKLYPIEFSDGFSLMINQYSGLLIYWQAENSSLTTIWNQETAEGDKTCTAIVFNNNTSIRTTNVNIENKKDYYAQFSPLDTQTLLKELADRGSFNLCGYTFSLKGSQALLSQNAPYNNLATY